MAKQRAVKRNKAYAIEQIIPESKGYLIVDPKKCTGCGSCMFACAMAHEGKSSIALSRIQILNDPFGHFPSDIQMVVCKQCLYPQCIVVCPTGAMHIDSTYKNVRRVDREKCIGCRKCMDACPFVPSRIYFAVDQKKVFKCDLCKETPYWKKRGGQACVEICPVNAIVFSAATPSPLGEKGYTKNLRGKGWEKLGLPTD
jgi:protein NrfC